jgi:hypothetical protein
MIEIASILTALGSSFGLWLNYKVKALEIKQNQGIALFEACKRRLAELELLHDDNKMEIEKLKNV